MVPAKTLGVRARVAALPFLLVLPLLVACLLVHGAGLAAAQPEGGRWVLAETLPPPAEGPELDEVTSVTASAGRVELRARHREGDERRLVWSWDPPEPAQVEPGGWITIRVRGEVEREWAEPGAQTTTLRVVLEEDGGATLEGDGAVTLGAGAQRAEGAARVRAPLDAQRTEFRVHLSGGWMGWRPVTWVFRREGAHASPAPPQPTGPTIVARFGAEGIALGAEPGSEIETEPVSVLTLADLDGVPVEALRVMVVERLALGEGAARVRIEADPEVAWGRVERFLVALLGTDVGVRHVAVADVSGAVALDTVIPPATEAAGVQPHAPAPTTIALEREGAGLPSAWTRVVLGDHVFALPGGEPAPAAGDVHALAQALGGIAAGEPAAAVEIDLTSRKGAAVPYGDVLLLARALEKAGLRNLRFLLPR